MVAASTEPFAVPIQFGHSQDVLSSSLSDGKSDTSEEETHRNRKLLVQTHQKAIGTSISDTIACNWYNHPPIPQHLKTYLSGQNGARLLPDLLF